MSYQEKEAKLLELFSLQKQQRGIIQPLYEAEHQAGINTQSYDGQRTFFHCFNEFYLETLQTVSVTIASKISSPSTSRYAHFLLFHVDQFKSMRCSEILFLKGYPYQGYALLRNVLEESIFMSAMLQGMTTVEKIEGIDGHLDGQPLDEKTIRNNRKNEQRKIISLMMGPKSGMSQDTIAKLLNWEMLFDKEIHGSRLSKTEKLEWLRSQGPLDILPAPRQSSDSMLLNRYNEMAWTLVRLMPMLQTDPYEFSPFWREKWIALDDWVHHAVEALTTQLRKPIGSAFVEFIQTKFPFSFNSEFPISRLD